MHTIAGIRELLLKARPLARQAGDPQPNILVISDLHLGEDVRPHSMGYLRRIIRLERELENFLAHYTRSYHDGRPWRLIINGDMVDFMSICLLPAKGESKNAEEERFGLG